MGEEYMVKVYNTVGEGVFELCNTVNSFAQAWNMEKACRCEICIECFGIPALDKKDEDREKMIKALTFETLGKVFDDIVEDAECFGNGTWAGTDEDGDRYLGYHTGGGLSVIIREIGKNDYWFQVYPPTEFFRAHSTLYQALDGIGYQYKAGWDYSADETKVRYKEYWEGERLVYREAYCEVCEEEIENPEREEYCPKCGRRIIAK